MHKVHHARVNVSLSDLIRIYTTGNDISRNGPYIGGHLAFYFKLNLNKFIMYYKSV